MMWITSWPVEPEPGFSITDGAAGALEPEGVPIFAVIGGGGGRGREESMANNYWIVDVVKWLYVCVNKSNVFTIQTQNSEVRSEPNQRRSHQHLKWSRQHLWMQAHMALVYRSLFLAFPPRHWSCSWFPLKSGQTCFGSSVNKGSQLL